MSRPSQQQPKQHVANPSDYNGASVIQNHVIHAAGAPPPGATAVVETAASSSLRPTLIGGLQQVPQLVPVNPPPLADETETEEEEEEENMKKPHAEKDSDEYRQRRERNNLAVKKSRMRSKQKAQDTQARVNELKEENERLEAKIKLLSKELSVLKDLFLEHAHNLAEHAPQPPGGGGLNDGTSPASNNNNNNSNGQ